MKDFVKVQETKGTNIRGKGYATRKIAIPKEIADYLGFNKGDKLLLEVINNKLIITK